ncbi:MAG TPA: FAD-dependent oxidoreductase, partial [Rhodocyclaceae bacterium]|nr:FAD-dependent oxidoreductase [Rhodocyclaceae bacterium]
HFTDRLTLIDLDGKANLSEDERAQLKAAGVAVRKISSSDVHLVDEHVHVPGEDKDTSDDLRFDAAYMMVGTAVRNELARSLGVGCDGEGYILTDRHQRTNIDGLYAAGDVAEGINQIAVAAGQAAIAASSIHMSLTKNYDK